MIATLPKLMLETFLIRMQKPIQYKHSKLTGTAAESGFSQGSDPDPVFQKSSDSAFFGKPGSGSGLGFPKGRILVN